MINQEDECQTAGSDGIRQASVAKSFIFFWLNTNWNNMGFVKISVLVLVKHGWDNSFDQIIIHSPTTTFGTKPEIFFKVLL